MAKNRLNGPDVTSKKPRHNDEHRDRRHKANHDTCNPHSEMRYRQQWAQFEAEEEQQRGLCEKIVECMISAEKDAQADKKTGRENSSRVTVVRSGGPQSRFRKAKRDIEKFVGWKHP